MTWTAEQLPHGILRLAFAGRGGIGSAGNADGARMREVIGEVLASYRPAALIIDLRSFEYRYGNWIGAMAVTARYKLKPGPVCILADGETGAAVRSLFEWSHLGKAIPLAATLDEALQCLQRSNSEH